MKVPEKFRLKNGNMGTTEADGNNGVFPIKRGKLQFFVIASDGMGWDHVSVTIANRQRTATWEEMCFIKDIFFSKDEWAVQFHPASVDYVDNHKYCLHLWHSQRQVQPRPLNIMV